MKNIIYDNVNFTYGTEKDRKYIESLKLKSYDGYDLFFLPNNYIPEIYVEPKSNIYFIEAIEKDLKFNSHKKEDLIEKYRKIYKYSKSISEWILLIDGNIVYIFADSSNYQDGKSVNLLEVISEDYTLNDAEWLKKLIETAFRSQKTGIPEYCYSDDLAVFKMKNHNFN